MINFVDVTKEQFVEVEHHFLEEPSMRISINTHIVPTCVTIFLEEDVIARAHLPTTKASAIEYKPEYTVRSDIFDEYLLTKYLS